MSSLRKLYRPSWAAWLSLTLNVVVLAALSYIIFARPGRHNDDVPDWLPYCKPCQSASDSIANAAQLGRLDVISVILAVLGVTLALASLGGFFIVRAAAMDAAREEVRTRIREDLPDLVTANIIAEALREQPALLNTVAGIMRESGRFDIDGSMADSIAGAVDVEDEK